MFSVMSSHRNVYISNISVTNQCLLFCSLLALFISVSKDNDNIRVLHEYCVCRFFWADFLTT